MLLCTYMSRSDEAPVDLQIVVQASVSPEMAGDPSWCNRILEAQRALGELMNYGTGMTVDLYLPGQQDPSQKSRALLEQYTPQEEIEKTTEPTPAAITAFLETPVSDMLRQHFQTDNPVKRQRHASSPTVRIENLLERIKVSTVRELLPIGTEQIKSVRNIGGVAVKHFAEAFQAESPAAETLQLLPTPSPTDIAPYCDIHDISLLAVVPPPSHSATPVKRYAYRLGELLALSNSELEARMNEGHGPAIDAHELRSEMTRYSNELLVARQALDLPKYRVRPTNLRRANR